MSKFSFPNAASEFIFVRTYSRWIEELKRRETWEETVDRYIDFIEKHVGNVVPQKVFRKARQAILSMSVMPSMRSLWSAGPAAEFDNACMYNCSYQNIDSIEAFAECLYVLMCGTGYGYSVEGKYVDKLPVIPRITSESSGTHQVEDSRTGWAESTRKLLVSLYAGKDLDMDYSKLRSKGARLKTMGGRSSGPEPLMRLHAFIREVFQKAQERKLTTIEVSDILNQTAEIVVMGGVRRSSEISLSDLDDDKMATAKMGTFPVRRYMSNNSAVYYDKPTAARFLKEWSILVNSGTGERGIFNLQAARKNAPERRNGKTIEGTNPCGEINLRSCEFCNLTEVVLRADDDLDDVLEKIETATWLGVIQSTFTYFPYLNKKWKKNCDEERLLGVSITGQMDNPNLLTNAALSAMKRKAIKIARHASQILKINMPAAITCVKPSGTVSQLVNSSSGIHTRYSRFYIRRYRISSTDPLYKMMRDQGVEFSPDNGQRKKDWNAAVNGNVSACSIYEQGKEWSEDKVTTWVVEFPIESPAKSVTRHNMSAITQLEGYKKIQEEWCEHNASMTVYVKDEEWIEVGNWVYKNWDIVNGLSFLPFEDHAYEQPPYEEVTKEEYEKMVKDMPAIDYSKLSDYETEDGRESRGELSCTSDRCEISRKD